METYRANGHEVFIQKGAGLGASFTDDDYRAKGANIVERAEAIWETCEMIIKVKEPLEAEYPLLRRDQILYTYLHLAPNRPLTDALLASGAKAVAYETVRDAAGRLPLLKPMSEVAGRLSVQEGAKYLEGPMGGRGVLLGGVPGVPRARVLIVGGGVVGINACKMVLRIHDIVKIKTESAFQITRTYQIHLLNIDEIIGIFRAFQPFDLRLFYQIVPLQYPVDRCDGRGRYSQSFKFVRYGYRPFLRIGLRR